MADRSTALHPVPGIWTPDGRYVLFGSGASDLVANDTNDLADVFVRDMQTETTRLISSVTTGPFLVSPIKNQSPYSAKVTAIFDHSINGEIAAAFDMTTTNFFTDDIVMAFNGEQGDYAVGYDLTQTECLKGNNGIFDLGIDYGLTLYKKPYLCYENHTGIDFYAETGTPVYAAGSGKIVTKECSCGGSICTASCTSGWGNHIKVFPSERAHNDICTLGRLCWS